MVWIAAVATLLCAPSAGSRPEGVRSFVLATVPSVGDVTWSCDPRTDSYALTLRLDRVSATTGVTLLGPRFRAKRILEPGGRATLPFVRSGTQRITAVQVTEARTLRASITATFARGRDYCFAYYPPQSSVRVRW